jgi:hypothetical protein
MLRNLFLAVFLFVFRDCAWSQEPPKTPQVEHQQQPESGLKAQENTCQYIKPFQWPLSSGPQIESDGAHLKTQSKAEEGSEHGTEFWPPLYGYRLKVTDTLLVGINVLLFLATFALWWSTRRLVRGGEQIAERQLRAYIFSDHAKVESFDTTPVVTVTFKNSGKTPAYNVIIRARYDTAVYPLEKKPEWPTGDSGASKGHIGPGVLLSYVGQPSDELTASQWAAIRCRAEALYIYGELTYDDAFGKPRFTKFCFMYGGDAGLNSQDAMATYSNGNDAN